jgi:4-hydroxybenzoate polyprenyl transferase
MKRFTHWPQLFLGITFNYGLILGWASINENISLAPLVFYFGTIFWTLGYDTIYGYQDIKDDEIVGVKSTSIKFKNNPKKILFSCYLITILSLIFLGFIMNFNFIYFLFLIIPFVHLFFFQLIKLNVKNPNLCLKIFKSNNLLGLIIFLNLLVGKLIL